MSDIDNGNGNGQATELDVIEARIRAEFPLSDPEALYRLLVRQAARTELSHRAAEHAADRVNELAQTVGELPCRTGSSCPGMVAVERLRRGLTGDGR